MKTLVNTLIKTAAITMTFLSLTVSAATIKTDVIFIVDESGSMGNVQTNLRNNIGLFASILSGGGLVDASFGLVGYGNGGVVPRTLTDLTDPTAFALAAGNLIASGGTEPAYDAIAYALNTPNAYPGNVGAFSFRNDAITNIILLTDEPHNGSSTTWADTDGFLKANSALFNVVTTNSGNATVNGGNFEQLAVDNGGAIFSLAAFNTNDNQVITDFVTDFANAKLQETIDFCTANPNDPACTGVTPVPAPQGLALLAMAIFAVRRMSKK
ncbi:VWA domain-containing protein [Glaciecola sp. SC05]|uniref:VWA domain-containing protein n=1 Tax=Glaciecola sp. SC05 TaxID=1987355 RepID=UPI003529342B